MAKLLRCSLEASIGYKRKVEVNCFTALQNCILIENNLTILGDTTLGDTSKVKLKKLFPAAKIIKSEDGAIIPKEAIHWMEIEPNVIIRHKKTYDFTHCLLYGAGTALILIVLFFVIRRILLHRKK